MNRTSETPTYTDRLLMRWAGNYILLVQPITLIISYISAIVGIYYIIVNVKVSLYPSWQLLATGVGLLVIVSLFMLFFTAIMTIHVRARLATIFKGKSIKGEEHEVEISAWKEIISLPRRYAVAELVTIYCLVALPAILFLRWIVGASSIQFIHFIIGGAISGLGVVVQNTLIFDQLLAPVRRSLLPKDPEQQNVRFGLRLQSRTGWVIGVLILSAILMIGPLGYQKLLNASLPGSDISQEIRAFQNQVLVIGILIVILAVSLGLLLSQTITRPLREMIQSINDVQSGDLSRRAFISTSDETAQLAIQLNQLFNLFQLSQTEFEHKVDERTSDLARKTLQLQTAAQVAREAASLQEPNILLARTADLISERFGYYHTGIFLLDDTGDYAVLLAASSKGGKLMLERGHRLEVGHQGIVGAAAFKNRPHVALDVGVDAAFFKNPDLPMTRSEVAIPLAVRNKVIGVLDIQSTESNAFTQEDVDSLQTLADQIALAIQNSRLISETQNALRQLEAITAENVKQSWGVIRQQKRGYRYSPIGLEPLPHSGGKPPTPRQEPSKIARLEIPIVLRGQRIGTIELKRKEESPWSQADQELANEITNQIGLALENSRLLEDAQRHAAQEQSLSKLSAQLGRSLDPDTLLQTAVRELHQLPNVTEVSVYITPSRQISEANTETSQRKKA